MWDYRSRPRRATAIAPAVHNAVEMLERRTLLSVFMVTNTGDNGGTNPAVGAGTGTLRQAIVDSNAHAAGTNTIDFDIASAGVQTIYISAPGALPTITQAVDINGASEPGYAGTPIVVIVGGAPAGLLIKASNSTVSDLDFESAGPKAAIEISGASGVTISGNYLGVDPTGAVNSSNAEGVQIDAGAQNNTIGGTTAGARNVISGNGLYGVVIDGTSSGPNTTGNVVEGNYIGTDATGTIPLGNGMDDVLIADGAQNNTIGGAAAGAGNVISGNLGNGVEIDGTSSGPNTTGNMIEGNYVGTDATGATVLGNGDMGIIIADGAQANTIGGTTAGARNVITGNANNGVEIAGTSSGPTTTGNTVEGNYIGTDATGTQALGNAHDGVLVAGGAQANTIGGTTAGARNVITGNAVEGVEIDGTTSGSNTTGNGVLGNYIGTDATGAKGLGNGIDGVLIQIGAQDNTIGGAAPGARNVISGNGFEGVEIDGTSSGPNTTGNTVEGNYIGTDATGTQALGNASDGVQIQDGAQNNTIGGAAAGAGNVISGNVANGVEIVGTSSGPNTTGNTVEGNYIGTDATGAKALGNGDGVLIASGVQGNTIGGTAAGAGNVISGNAFNGVEIAGISSGPNTTGNGVLGNFIGTNAAGSGFLANGNDGVLIDYGAQNNTIGGAAAGAGNVISGNIVNGVEIDGESSGPNTTGNVVLGNLIGTDATGANPLGNGNDGVVVGAGATHNIIGGTVPVAGNSIAYNGGYGVEVIGFNTNLNPIRFNSIYDNAKMGIALTGGGTPGPNDEQTSPDLAMALTGASGTVVTGVFSSTPSTNFFLDFYTSSGVQLDGTAQAKTHIGTFIVTTDSSGNAILNLTMPSALAAGAYLTATATTTANPTYGDTSQFASPVQVTAPVDTTPPTAALTSAPTLTTASSMPYSFSVTVTDNVDVKASTLGNANFLITGPGGYSQWATLTSTGLGNAPSLVATYTVPAPSGGWQSSSNGSYTVTLEASQISDTSGNFAAAGSLGFFNVNIGLTGSLTATQVAAAACYNLTTLGTTDWVHWGRKGVFSNVDRDATGGGQISSLTDINPGGASFGGYTDSSRSVTWTNGSPTSSDSGDDGYVWANNAVGAGFSLTVPASTTTRTVYVYAGGYDSGATLTAHLSDNSATDYVATASGTGIYTQFYAITYQAASAGQTLTITYVKNSTVNNLGGSVDLIAVALDPPPASAPKGVVQPMPAITAASTGAYDFSVTWNDSVAITAATLDNYNLLITGPDGYSRLASLLSTGLSNGKSIVASYAAAAPKGGWGVMANGTYTITVQANQIEDASGDYAAAGKLASFSVSIARERVSPVAGPESGGTGISGGLAV